MDSDTVHCYDRSEMRAIALRVIEATECDTITGILQEEIAVRDSVINLQDKIIAAKTSEIRLTQTMLEDSEQLAKNYEEELKTEAKKHKFTKVKLYVYIGLTIVALIFTTR